MIWGSTILGIHIVISWSNKDFRIYDDKIDHAGRLSKFCDHKSSRNYFLFTSCNFLNQFNVCIFSKFYWFFGGFTSSTSSRTNQLFSNIDIEFCGNDEMFGSDRKLHTTNTSNLSAIASIVTFTSNFDFVGNYTESTGLAWIQHQ